MEWIRRYLKLAFKICNFILELRDLMVPNLLQQFLFEPHFWSFTDAPLKFKLFQNLLLNSLTLRWHLLRFLIVIIDVTVSFKKILYHSDLSQLFFFNSCKNVWFSNMQKFSNEKVVPLISEQKMMVLLDNYFAFINIIFMNFFYAFWRSKSFSFI